MMKYYELDDEEKEILESFEKGKFKSIPNVKSEIKRFQKIARNTLAKNANINLRLTEKVLLKLKAKAAELGIPYQTLISSILHRAANSPKPCF